MSRTADNEKTLDLSAKHYRAHSILQFSLAEDLFELHKFRSDENILDIGCGDGRLTTKLAQKVPHGRVDGKDPSLSMISLAKETFPNAEYPNLSFSTGAAESFQSDRLYDLITAFSCLHWVRGQGDAFAHMTKFLKKNGKLLALTFIPQGIALLSFIGERCLQ